jgi:hypothetical protein
MAIKNMPVAVEGTFIALLVSSVSEKSFTNDNGVVELSTTKDGVVNHKLTVTLAALDGTGANQLVVTVPNNGVASNMTIGLPVTFTNLRFSEWAMNGRTGLSFSADTVMPADFGAAAGGAKASAVKAAS